MPDTSTKPATVEVVTPAPEDYDGFRSRTVEWLPYASNNGNQFRRVRMLAEHAWWQTMRYSSGLYGVVTPEEWTTKWLPFADGLMKPAEPRALAVIACARCEMADAEGRVDGQPVCLDCRDPLTEYVEDL
jgi:hypothetical protein